MAGTMTRQSRSLSSACRRSSAAVRPSMARVGAIQRDRHIPVRTAERLDATRAFQLIEHSGEHRTEQRRIDRVKHGPEVIIGGDTVQAEQRLAVGSSVAFFQLALMREERGALHEERREGGQCDVGHRIDRVVPVTFVRERLAALAQRADQGLQALHLGTELQIRALGYPLFCARSTIYPRMLHFGLSQTRNLRDVRIENRCRVSTPVCCVQYTASDQGIASNCSCMP